MLPGFELLAQLCHHFWMLCFQVIFFVDIGGDVVELDMIQRLIGDQYTSDCRPRSLQVRQAHKWLAQGERRKRHSNSFLYSKRPL